MTTQVTLEVLEVSIEQSDKARLAELAEASGRTVEELAAAAIHDLLDFHDAEIEKIKRGYASLERGEGVPHEDVKAWAKSLGTANPLPRPGRRKG